MNTGSSWGSSAASRCTADLRMAYRINKLLRIGDTITPNPCLGLRNPSSPTCLLPVLRVSTALHAVGKLSRLAGGCVMVRRFRVVDRISPDRVAQMVRGLKLAWRVSSRASKGAPASPRPWQADRQSQHRGRFSHGIRPPPMHCCWRRHWFFHVCSRETRTSLVTY